MFFMIQFFGRTLAAWLGCGFVTLRLIHLPIALVFTFWTLGSKTNFSRLLPPSSVNLQFFNVKPATPRADAVGISDSITLSVAVTATHKGKSGTRLK